MNPTTEDTPAFIFASNTAKRGHLATLLNDPVLQEAIGIAEDQMAPKTGTQADMVPAYAAARFNQVAGANDLLKHLKNLTREPSKTPAPKVKNLAKSLDDLPK